MKFTYLGGTNIAWAELLKEFPPEHVRALNSKRVNVQSLTAYLRLLTALDSDTDVDTIKPPPYIMELASMSFWFELPFTLVEEVLTKTRVRGVNVQQARSDINRGILVGTVGAWIEMVRYKGSRAVTTEFSNLSRLVSEVLERENLTFLLEE